MKVIENTVVYFRYTMKNARGEVMEDTMAGAPKCYLHGASGIQLSLQRQFEGLKEGDTRVIYLKKEIGTTGEDFTFNVIIDKIRPALKEEQILGYPVTEDRSICDSDCIC